MWGLGLSTKVLIAMRSDLRALTIVSLAIVAIARTPSPTVATYVNYGDPEEFVLLTPNTAWGPGPANDARFGGNPAPGSATWSFMAAGIAAPAFVPDTTHTGVSTTMDLMGPVGTADEIAIINAALNLWAAVSGFTNLGMVSDGGGTPGDPQIVGPGGPDEGDIRIGAYNFPAPVMGGFTLAHAFQPFVEPMFLNGTAGGDMHINNFVNGPAGAMWVDDPSDTSGGSTFDLFTVVLHEFGHALGLDHTGVDGSVMEPFYEGAKRTLSADDIAGIQAIYGVSAVPEPSAFVFFLVVSGAVAFPIALKSCKGRCDLALKS
jgi:hypothetical protein